jgi:hypothetical protein
MGCHFDNLHVSELYDHFHQVLFGIMLSYSSESPSSAEVKNAWSYTSTPPYLFMAWYLLSTVYIFMTWCLIKRRDNFTTLPYLYFQLH